MKPQTRDEIFKSDKSTWFIEVEEGIRIWNLKLVREFWELLKTEKINKNDFYFDGFVFPTFSDSPETQLNIRLNYFVKIFGSNGNILKNKISFINCRFQGDMLFLGQIPGVIDNQMANITISDSLIFTKCTFEMEFRLQAQKILKDLRISKCKFFGESNILLSHINSKLYVHDSSFTQKFSCHDNKHGDNVSFSSIKFNNDIHFGQNKFAKIFSFNTIEINGNSRFHNNKYGGNFTFAAIQLNNNSFFKQEVYNKGYFQAIEFSIKNHSFEDILLPDSASSLTFRNTLFSKSVRLKNCDTNKMIFLDSDISDVKFSSCNWNSPDRLIIFDENKRKDSIIELKKLENIYRQLKKNFDNFKDWELSGKAYVSEMTIRKHRLWKEKNYTSWFIYSFYDVFGGFTQNYIKPLKWFLLFTLFIFPLYYLIFESFDIFNIYQFEYQDCSATNAFIKSLSSSLPLIKTNLYYNNWWIQSSQTIFSTILITFFVLGLRKRFKQ